MAQHRIEQRLSRFGPLRTGAYRVTHLIVLAIGLTAMAAMTAPDTGAEMRTWLTVCLWCCLVFFTCELLASCWPRPGPESVTDYLRSAPGLIDVLAVLPIPIALLIGVPANTAWLLASLWLLKLTAIVPGFSVLGRVIALEARALASVLVIFLIVLLLAATALYVLERELQPTHFGSLPLSLWWAVTTLTTTGYGDAVPETFLGRVIAGMVMICGLGVFGLWAGILANGFADEHRRRNFVQNWDLITRVPFLQNLDPPAVISLTRMLRRIDLAPRTVVVRRGRPGDCMYFIASGEVEVAIEPRPIRLGPGSFFGEIALLKDTARTATVTTAIASTLLVL
ncbi:MAG TPA: ion transporter, partial [Lacipirellulaceae bacterium]|nr:ion transporter [Lacipirellulaceae bacterium]